MVIRENVLGKSAVEFCRHALDQMEIRGISADDVIRALRSPTETGLPCDMFRSRIRRQVSRLKALDVVYEERDDRILVITAITIDLKKRR